MLSYRHTQTGWLMATALGIGALVAGGATAYAAHDVALAWVPGSVALIMALCCVLFCSLTVTVSADRIALHFGPGVIGKSFAINDVCAVAVVRNHWYYGWGIRLVPGGWLFNVSGLDAVEIELANGRKYRIGTDEPQQLHDAIRTALDQRHQAR